MIFIILAHMARARLRDRHQESLRRKLEVLKAEQAVATTSNVENTRNAPGTPVSVKANSIGEADHSGSGVSQDEENSESEGLGYYNYFNKIKLM